MASPNITISVEPVQNGKATYLPIAGATSGASAKAKIVLRLDLRNSSTAALGVTGISFTFPGSSTPPIQMKGVAQFFSGYYKDDGGATIAPGKSKAWTNGVVKLDPNDDKSAVDNAVYLSLPAPSQIEIRVTCAGFSDPAKILLGLGPHKSGSSTGAYLFPFHARDLRVGEAFVGAGSHWANGGASGTQIFAHDLGCEAYDAATQKWTAILPGTSGKANADFRVYGKPLRALADGVVDSWHDGMADNTVIGSFPKPTPSPGGGNLLRIIHGDEKVIYCHLQNGSIPSALKVKGAAVKAGQVIGRVGNTGNSSAPHTHVECVSASDGRLRPLPFTQAHVVAQGSVALPDPKGPWSKLTAHGLPAERVAVWPADSAPAWYPPGWAELTHHGVAEASYQTIFGRATSSGYRPVWLDGYEVQGKTYFNVIFRPAGSTPWVARHGLSALAYQEEFNTRTKEGYRLSNVTSYVSGGSVRYAAIFEKSAGPAWMAYHGLHAQDHQQRFNQWTADGYRPVNVSMTSAGGTPLFTAFYEKKDVGSFVHLGGLTSASYQSAWNENTAAGRQLAYLSAYQQGTGMRFSAIFQEKLVGSGTIGRHDLTSQQFQAEFDKRLSEGYLTRVLVGYEVGGSARFAAAWDKPVVLRAIRR